MAGYTYQAENYCTRCILSEVVRIAHGNGIISDAEAGPFALAALDVRQGHYSTQSRDTLAAAGLERIAEILGVDMSDSYSYDSDDFPKYFPTSEDDEVCASCGDVIAGDHLERPEVIQARAEGAQRALASVESAVADALESAVHIASAFGESISPEVLTREAVRVIAAELDLWRNPDCEAPEVRTNYRGTLI